MAVSQALAMAAPGAENRWDHACSTALLVNALSRPPITMAVKIARKVTVTVLPSSTDSRRIWPNDLRVVPPASSGLSTMAGPGGACSLIAPLLAVPLLTVLLLTGPLLRARLPAVPL